MEQKVTQSGQPRRTFLTGLAAAVSGVTAFLAGSRRARAAQKTPTVPAQGPLLYRRTEEAERYYKTLYQ